MYNSVRLRVNNEKPNINMSLAREINKKLDEILSIKNEINKLREEVSPDALLTNHETGDTMSRDDAIKVAEGVIERINDDLNKLTNQGQNVRNIFDNTFYINDLLQDKERPDGVKSKKQTKSNKIKKKYSKKWSAPPSGFKSSPKPQADALNELKNKLNKDGYFDKNGKISQEEFMKKLREYYNRKQDEEPW